MISAAEEHLKRRNLKAKQVFLIFLKPTEYDMV